MQEIECGCLQRKVQFGLLGFLHVIDIPWRVLQHGVITSRRVRLPCGIDLGHQEYSVILNIRIDKELLSTFEG